MPRTPQRLENVRVDVTETSDGRRALDVALSGGGESNAVAWFGVQDTFSALLKELRIMNMHLEVISGCDFSKEDVSSE